MPGMRFENIIITPQVRPFVGLIQLNRPNVLNALNYPMMGELVQAMANMDADPDTRCIVLTGNGRAFAAGVDVNRMAKKSVSEMQANDLSGKWAAIKACKTPLIAAVSGFALGGGCELAMLCDMIVASESARFGQPEIKVGIMPGAGGTQRLTRAIGKARAMEMVLAGRYISGKEAHEVGLVNRVVPPELYLEAALELAAEVASMAPLAAQRAKEAVLQAFELPLSEGLEFERKNFWSLFETEDQKEGMAAFLEKRKPKWKGK